MATKVKNLNGTSDNRVPYGYDSWLDFWEKNPVKRQRNVLIVQTVHRLELMFKKLIAMIVHGTLFLCVVVVTVNHLLKNLQFMMYLFL